MEELPENQTVTLIISSEGNAGIHLLKIFAPLHSTGVIKNLQQMQVIREAFDNGEDMVFQATKQNLQPAIGELKDQKALYKILDGFSEKALE